MNIYCKCQLIYYVSTNCYLHLLAESSESTNINDKKLIIFHDCGVIYLNLKNVQFKSATLHNFPFINR